MTATQTNGQERMTAARDLALDALGTVEGARRKEYGEVTDSFEGIASIWTGILGFKVSAREVALCMAGLKLYRESHQAKRDNRLDAVGYMLLLEEMDAASVKGLGALFA